MNPNDIKTQSTQIAAALDEQEDIPLRRIQRILRTLGLERTQALVDEAKTIEAQGGLLVLDGSRRRTLGGTFFVLVHHTTTEEERRHIFLRKGKVPERPPIVRADTMPPSVPPNLSNKPSIEATPAAPAITWPDRIPLLPELKQHHGEAKTVKATLIGRPGRVVIKGDTVITSMQTTKIPNAFPKGVPAPPNTPTLYTIYIGKKQWNNVAEAIQNPDDALIIEGYPAYDPELEGIAIFATNITTKLLQAAKRQQQTSG